MLAASRISFGVGTRVAKQFRTGVFEGSIARLFKTDEQLCQVVFDDGDACDMDVKEVLEAVAMFEQHLS